MEETKNFTGAYFVLVGPNTPYKQKHEENVFLCDASEKYDKAIEEIKIFLEDNDKVHVILNTHGLKGEVSFGKSIKPEEEFKKLDPEEKKEVTISVFACEAGKDIKEDQDIIPSRTKNLKLSSSHNLVIYAGSKATFMIEGDIMIGRLIGAKMPILPIIYISGETDDYDIHFTPPETIKVVIGQGKMNEPLIKEFSPFKQFKEAISFDKVLSEEEIVRNIIEQQQEVLEFCKKGGIITEEGKKQLEKIKNIQNNLHSNSYQPMVNSYLAALLSLSAFRDKPQYIEYLVTNKIVDVDAKFLGFNAIGTAIEFNNFNSVKTLLELGADINAVNDNGETPLILTIKAIGNKKDNNLEKKLSYQKIAKFLINQEKIDLNKASKDGITPLGLALDNDYSEIVELLLKRGAEASNFYDKLREKYGNVFPDISYHKFEFLRYKKDEDFFCKETDKKFPLLENDKANNLFERCYYALKVAYHLEKEEKNIPVKFDNFIKEITKKYKLEENGLTVDFRTVTEKIFALLKSDSGKKKFLLYCQEKGDENIASQIENLIKEPNIFNSSDYLSQKEYEERLYMKEEIILNPKKKPNSEEPNITLKISKIPEKEGTSQLSLKPPNSSPTISEELKLKTKQNQKTK